VHAERTALAVSSGDDANCVQTACVLRWQGPLASDDRRSIRANWAAAAVASAAGRLSQEALAAQAGLSRRGISDLERGARRAPHPATRLVVRRQVDEAQRLVAATETFWFHAARLAEGRRWAEEVFALDPVDARDAGPQLREKVGQVVTTQAPAGAARQLYLRASVLKSIATLSVGQGDHIAAERAAYRSLQLFDQLSETSACDPSVRMFGAATCGAR
jgi:hypothetical protein